jgi:hypothetical protein
VHLGGLVERTADEEHIRGQCRCTCPDSSERTLTPVEKQIKVS